MKRVHLLWSALLALSVVGCDEGRIYEREEAVTEEGRVVKLTATLTGLDYWHESYDIVLAGFGEGSSYSVIAKDVSVAMDATGRVEMVMAGVGDEVRTIEVCACNSTRERIATFYSVEAPATADTIVMDAGRIDVSMYRAVQERLFAEKCIQCHGAGSGEPSAGLHLTAGQSYADLVRQPSAVASGETRVVPGQSSRSLLYTILTTDVSASWPIDHSRMIASEEELLRLLRNWIDNGAWED